MHCSGHKYTQHIAKCVWVGGCVCARESGMALHEVCCDVYGCIFVPFCMFLYVLAYLPACFSFALLEKSHIHQQPPPANHPHPPTTPTHQHPPSTTPPPLGAMLPPQATPTTSDCGCMVGWIPLTHPWTICTAFMCPHAVGMPYTMAVLVATVVLVGTLAALGTLAIVATLATGIAVAIVGTT